MFPKLHPIYKTALELKRSIGRLEGYLASYPEDGNDAEIVLGMIEDFKQTMEKIPKHYRAE